VSTPTTSPRATKPLNARDRHFVDRFSYGHTPALDQAVRSAGGGRAWFEDQLSPDRIKDKPGGKVRGWYPSLWYSPAKLFYRNYHDIKPAWEVMTDFGRWTMMRRTLSTHQVHELMVEFWSNLLHVPVGDDSAWPYRIAYDKLIRAHALGRFDDMLVKTTTHPCMGLYLDNATSTKRAPNENLGRELLELHTVGVDAGYTEKDVKSSAKMLTGYRAEIYARGPKGEYDAVWAKYVTDDHYVGKLKIFGFKSPNKHADGRKATEQYLRYLAHHPATAKRIAHRLAVRFVSDDPSADLVRTVARAWTRSGTDVKATLRALVAHPQFASSAGRKVRMPLEDTIATIRALEIKPKKPKHDGAFADAIFWVASNQGMTPYDWPAPNGHPESNGPWSSAGRALTSFDMHRSLGARWWPRQDAHFPPYAAFLPALPAKYGEVIDHASVKLLGVHASGKVKDAIALRSGRALNQKVTASDMSDGWVAQLLTALLSSPTHMTR